MCSTCSTNLWPLYGADVGFVAMQMQLKSAPANGLPILTKFTIEERGAHIEVQPLLVIVHQETPDGIAR